jgi:hypothetical protein
MNRFEKLYAALEAVRTQVREHGNQFLLITVIRDAGIYNAEDAAARLQRYGLVRKLPISIAPPHSWRVDMNSPIERVILRYNLHKEPDPSIRTAINAYLNDLEAKAAQSNPSIY